MIEIDYVSFKIAKLLKKKGFNEPCRYYFEDTGRGYLKFMSDDYKKTLSENEYLQPTLYEVQKWLREKYGIDVLIGKNDRMKKYYSLNNQECYFDTYEAALNEGIKEALKYI